MKRLTSNSFIKLFNNDEMFTSIIVNNRWELLEKKLTQGSYLKAAKFLRKNFSNIDISLVFLNCLRIYMSKVERKILKKSWENISKFFAKNYCKVRDRNIIKWKENWNKVLYTVYLQIFDHDLLTNTLDNYKNEKKIKKWKIIKWISIAFTIAFAILYFIFAMLWVFTTNYNNEGIGLLLQPYAILSFASAAVALSSLIVWIIFKIKLVNEGSEIISSYYGDEKFHEYLESKFQHDAATGKDPWQL